MIEIERRFLVAPESLRHLDLALRRRRKIEQFYLTSDPERSVRVRIEETCGTMSACLAIKGRKTTGQGIEVETPIQLAKAEALKPLILGRSIVKTRHEIPLASGLTAELDVFSAPAGLVIAEVEFADAEAATRFTAPVWMECEITDDPAYSNQALALAGK